MHAVIICGSRDWSDSVALLNVITDLPIGTVVIHGDARGADRMAAVGAKSCGLPVLPMPAQWGSHHRSAGPRRNAEMLRVLLALQECGYKVKVLAFPLSTSRGTVHMMEIALKAGVTVRAHGGD